MKLLHVITSLYIGGAERLVVDIAPLFKVQGIDIDVLLFDGTNTFLKEELKSKGINIIEFTVGGNVYSVSNLFKLRKILKRYDIVHTHNTACQYYVAMASVTLSTPPILITTEHNTINRRRNLFFFKIFDIWMYSQYSAIISISKETTSHLLKYLGCKFDNIHTINNGINIDKYQNAFSLYRQKEKFVILMIAGFREQKDQDTVIRALALLPEKFTLWFVGSGQREKECMELTQKLNVSHRIHFWGVRKDIPNLVKSSDVVVMSSHWEGFGLAVVEGMAGGKPVLASDVPGLSEVVKGAGLLFEKGNHEQLRKLIEELLSNPELYKKISFQCSMRAMEYGIDKMVNSYLMIYNLFRCK